MAEAEGACVQRLAWAGLETVVDEAVVRRGAQAAKHYVAAVTGVVEQRVAYAAHVGTDLVGAACFEHASDERDVAEAFCDLVVGHGVAADAAVRREDGHAETVARVAVDVAYDGSLGRVRDAPYQGQIFAARGLVEKLASEVGLRVGRFGYYQQSGSVFVDTVDKAQAGVVDIIVGGVAEMPGQGVYQRAAVVAVSGMDHEAGGLVYDEHRAVFIDDVKGDVLGNNFEFIARAVHHHLDHVEGLDAIVRLHGASVDKDAARFGRLLDAVARRPFQACHEEFVYAEQLLALVGNEAKMLVKT